MQGMIKDFEEKNSSVASPVYFGADQTNKENKVEVSEGYKVVPATACKQVFDSIK